MILHHPNWRLVAVRFENRGRRDDFSLDRSKEPTKVK